MISSRSQKLFVSVTAVICSSLANADNPGATPAETVASVQDPLAMTSLWQMTLGMMYEQGLGVRRMPKRPANGTSSLNRAADPGRSAPARALRQGADPPAY